VPGHRAETGPDQASPARVYEYLTGGSDYFPADKALAVRLADPGQGGYAGLPELARANRSFVLKAAGWAAAMLGISQYLDLGCGLPSRPMVHDRARQAVPAATAAYVDIDAMVVRHMRCVQAEEGWAGTAVIEGDAEDPASVLADTGLLEVTDLSRPVCAVFGGTLSTMDADVARAAVKGFAEALAPGSAVIISCASYASPGFGAAMAAAFSPAGQWRNHMLADVESFFAAAGLRIVHGRPMDVSTWPLACGSQDSGASVIGGAGLKLGAGSSGRRDRAGGGHRAVSPRDRQLLAARQERARSRARPVGHVDADGEPVALLP
jgi:S-adenosyl methyltransferase